MQRRPIYNVLRLIGKYEVIHLYIVIIQIKWSVCLGPKVITLSGTHCIKKVNNVLFLAFLIFKSYFIIDNINWLKRTVILCKPLNVITVNAISFLLWSYFRGPIIDYLLKKFIVIISLMLSVFGTVTMPKSLRNIYNTVLMWFESNNGIQWPPLNGITDNGINWIIKSLLGTFTQSHQL